MTNTVFRPPRIRIFIDFWNFSLNIRRIDDSFRLDWTKIAPALTTSTVAVVGGVVPGSYEAMHVFGSYDPAKQTDSKLKQWFTTWLDKQPGVHVELLERRRKKGFPKCPVCQAEQRACYHCGGDPRGTEEKGVDTRMGLP